MSTIDSIKQAIHHIRGIYFRTLGYYPARLNDTHYRCDPDHAVFWRRASRGTWEPQTFLILSKFLTPDSVYYDIGAWIGPTVIYAAKRSKRVVCFEPDTAAYQYLIQNLRLNGINNVLTVNAALADRNGILKMASFDQGPGDSMTSLLNNEATFESTIDVLAITWQTWTECFKEEKIDFIKMDVEGAEFSLLPTLMDYLFLHKPILYLSTHSPYLSVSLRKESVEQIAGVFKIYSKCLNEKLEPVEVDDFISENALNGFHAYLFMD